MTKIHLFAVPSAILVIFLQLGCEKPFLQTNYEAVDTMLSCAMERPERDDRILATTFVDVDDVTRADSLGRVIGEICASRLTQRDYTVVTAKLRQHTPNIPVPIRASTSSLVVKPKEGEFALSRDVKNISRNLNAEYVLVGMYRKTPDAVTERTDWSVGTTSRKVTPGMLFVSMRLIRSADNVVIAANDYSIKNTDEINALTK